jgi:hypothetical protein
MADYNNEFDIHIMICDKGSKNVNFNIKKPNELNVGDTVTVNRGDFKKVIEIESIIECRQSSLNDFNYITTTITNPF